MKRWSLQFKVSIYSTLLIVLALLGTMFVILPIVYQRQLGSLDENLRENVKELADVLQPRLYPGEKPAATGKTSPTATSPARLGKPAVKPEKIPGLIPSSLNRRYIIVKTEAGEELFRTKFAAFKELDLPPNEEGMTVWVGDSATGRNSRFAYGKYGPLKIWVGTRLGTIEGVQNDLLMSFAVVIPLVTIAVFIGSIFLARHSLKPVSAMTAAAERIGAHAPEERLPIVGGDDEVGRLTTVLNQSFDRLQRAYNSAARFSADASHQLKTPIAVLRAGLDELKLCRYLEPQDRETVDILLHQTRRLTTLVEDLLLLAQADAGRLKVDPLPLDLAPLLAVVLDDTEALGMEKDLIITLDVPEQLYALADARRVKIILQNLTENAVKYNEQGGRIRLNGRREGKDVLICVANTGGAISDQHRERLFERFNRAGMGENIKGHGLGLNIARELARAHGGDLLLVRSEKGWTEFAVKLPACDAPAHHGLPVLNPAA